MDEKKIITAEQIINNEFELADLEMRHYIPFNEKKDIIYAIIDTLLLEDNGMVMFDEIDRFVTFIMIALDKYVTNVDFEGKYIECYDALTESEKIAPILDMIGKDVEELKGFFDMECNSRLQQNSIENVLNRNLAELNITISEAMNKVITNVTDIGASLNSELSKGGMEKLVSAISKAIK